MKYSSGPQVPTMPKDGSDLVEVRSRAGDARQFSPSAARNRGPIRGVRGVSPAPGFPKQLLIDTLI